MEKNFDSIHLYDLIEMPKLTHIYGENSNQKCIISHLTSKPTRTLEKQVAIT